ncbi:DUF4124 domain-containing protein [Pelomonas sp. V22]|uniref:DUF4124 domain-containing protein n=1 Tax=Pelomonas sp. V22 TaxID=2822139 RepID=UPI0024A8B2CF|nr:DUF4124 domain-containing protein [Pelomonas sp. V22]MDI4632070.1 DUF4124 domain-containing protein [Pelomonas sp. V22]
MRLSRLSPTLCLLLLLTLVGSAQAQWKWKDSSGNVQYSDRPPPPGTPEKDILQKPPQRYQPVVVRQLGASAPEAAAAAAPASAASRPDAQAQARQRQQEQEQAAKQKEEERKQAAQRAENCRNAKGQLQMLESGVRVRQTNAQGEPVVLDDKQRAEEMQRSRAVIASECR